MPGVRVRFLTTKRYPHPSGPKRHPGSTLEVPATLASLWASNGILEILEDAERVERHERTEDAAAVLLGTNLVNLRAVLEDAPESVVREAQALDTRKGAVEMYHERLEREA